MSKKLGKSVPAPETSGGERPAQTIFDQLEQTVWNRPTYSEQYEAFNKAFNYHVEGVCRETILSQELFLIALQCRQHGITANKLAIVIDCLKQLFESLQTQQLQTQRQAFDWVCSYLKQRTETGEDAPGYETNGLKLSADQCSKVVEYISESILKEFDLFAAVLGYAMDYDQVAIAKHLPTPIQILPSLSSANYEPIQSQPEPSSTSFEQQRQEHTSQHINGETSITPLDETKEKIIAKMVAADVSKAKTEVERTIANYKAELESRTKA